MQTRSTAQPVSTSQSAVVSPAIPASVLSTTVPTVTLGSQTIPAAVLNRFPADVARKYQMVVYKVSPDGKVASVGAVNPDDRRVREILKFVQERNNLRIELSKISKADLERALTGYDSPEVRSQSPSPQGFGGPGKSEVRKTDQVGMGPGSLGRTNQVTKSSSHQVTTSPKPDRTGPVSLIPHTSRLTERPDLKLATTDTIKAAAQKPQAVIPPPVTTAPSIPSAAPVRSPIKIGGVTPASPRQGRPVAVPYQQAPVSPVTAPVAATKPVSAPAAPPAGDERNLDAMLGTPVTAPEQLEQIVKSGMVPKIVAAIVSLAVSLSASDIHLEAGRDAVRIRYRVDGELAEIMRVPSGLLAPLVSRLKILAKLKIDESRIPQDGRFDVWLAGHDIDLRMSTLPTIHGEKVVLRILDKSAGLKSLEDLGVSGTNLTRLRSVIADPFGIILVSGPTGSGKTSTLYALLSELNRDGVNIVTLEDPVEYQLAGINQTQVKPAIGFGFADGLRSILRQDPNIVMVGEIRDRETAALATQAALTGHLVLSTLHTNDAAGAIPRMIDMGVEPFLLASSLKAVIGQRLVRRLSSEGTQPATVSPELLAQLKAELAAGKAPEVTAAATADLKFLAPKDGRASYHGRVGIYEVLTLSEVIADLVLKKSVASSIAEAASAEGMVTMRQDGLLKALAGVTSLEEVLTATADS